MFKFSTVVTISLLFLSHSLCAMQSNIPYDTQETEGVNQAQRSHVFKNEEFSKPERTLKDEYQFHSALDFPGTQSSGGGWPPDPYKYDKFLNLHINRLQQLEQLEQLQLVSPVGIFSLLENPHSRYFELPQSLLENSLWENRISSKTFDDSKECMPSLPDEILFFFVAPLSKQDYIQASRVSKRFYRITHDKQVVIENFKLTSTNPSQLGIRIKEIEERFNALWPATSNLEQREAETQAFETDFQEDINILWKQMKFYSKMLNSISPSIAKLLSLDCELFTGIKDDTPLGKLVYVHGILSSLGSGDKGIDSKFHKYAQPLFLKLNQDKLLDCRFGSWKLSSILQFQPIQLPSIQLSGEDIFIALDEQDEAEAQGDSE